MSFDWSAIGGPIHVYCYTYNVEDTKPHTLALYFSYNGCGRFLCGFANFAIDGSTDYTVQLCVCAPRYFNNILAPDVVVESYYSQNGADFQKGYSLGYMQFLVSGTTHNEPVFAYNGAWETGTCSVPSSYQTGNFNVGGGLAPPSTYMGVTGHSRGWGGNYEFMLTGQSATGKVLSYNIPTQYCNGAIANP